MQRINYLDTKQIFKIYLFTQKEKEENEYEISANIKRVIIKNPKDTYLLIRNIYKNKIDIFIYQFPNQKEIKALNNLKDVKTIFYIHSSFFYWFYAKFYRVLKVYNEYKNSKYIVSLIPLEHDYLFKKWGIKSVLFENFLTYDYNSIIPSDLSKNNILLIGRGRSKLKRFEIGIESIEYIRNKIADVKLLIISKIIGVEDLQNYIDNLNLNNNIKFVNYSSDPSIHFKYASLNFLTSISECYPLVLSETKIHGIPTIILGLDYIALAKKGTIMIYDDSPETLAKESIKILSIKIYKENLARDARFSMKNFNNSRLLHKWEKLLISVYNNDENYYRYFNETKNNKFQLYKILLRQTNLIKKRIPELKNICISDLENLININISKIIIKN